MESKDIDRFWSKVNIGKSNECWEWLTTLYVDGYGQFMINRTSRRSHRISYELNHGPIPNNMVIMHTCDNRKCVNPAHLKLGTQQQNIQDMFAKGRQPKISRAGTANGRAKLNEDAARYIKQHGVKGRGGNVVKLAEKYNVSTTQILCILDNKSWSHI